MAGFNLRSNVLVISFVLLINGIAKANCSVVFINSSNSTYLSIGNVADKTDIRAPMAPKGLSILEKKGAQNSRDEFYIQQYAVLDKSPRHERKLVLELVANVYVFDGATITILDPKDKQKGALSVHVDYLIPRNLPPIAHRPVHAPAPAPHFSQAPSLGVGAHAPGHSRWGY